MDSKTKLVKPHPPPGPVDKSLLRIQKTRVRMINKKAMSTATAANTEQDSDAPASTVPPPAVSEIPDHKTLSQDEELAIKVLKNSGNVLQGVQSISSGSHEQVYSYHSTPKSAERHHSLAVCKQ